jgi:phosphoglycerate kinase
VTIGVPLLRDRKVAHGERWIYSAGFNVKPNLSETDRVDCELADLDHLAQSGARVALLSHQGEHGAALDLDFVATYLSGRLGRLVRYVPTCVGEAAQAQARGLAPGEVAVFGNTRHHAGEQANEPALAREFAALGDVVAIGGFSKAHRSHASNVGILAWLPGCLADNVSAELERLAPWAGASTVRFSVAAIGGTKREKTEIALKGLVRIYDAIIPGGAVLNNLLKARGMDVGASVLGERPAATTAVAAAVLQSQAGERICWPQQLVVATKTSTGSFSGSRRIAIGERIDAHEAIVDCVLGPRAVQALERVVVESGRLLVAGPPSASLHRFGEANLLLMAAARELPHGAIFLGGDTACELPFAGNRSTGGGSALHYLVHGRLPIQYALAANAVARRPTSSGTSA